MTYRIDIHPMNLGTLGSACDDQFAAALAQVQSAFHNCEDLEATKDGHIKAQISLTLDFEYSPKTGGVLMASRVQHKLPKNRQSGRGVRLHDDGFYVEGEIDEAPLFDRDPQSPTHRTRPVPVTSGPQE